ncbi:MAG: hypothetical protein ACYDHP_06715 [Ferrimicrobium sp.]
MKGSIIAAVLGGLLFFWVTSSIVRTLLVPRGYVAGIAKIIDRTVAIPFTLISRNVSRYKRRDQILSYQGSVVLITTLGVWVLLYITAFSLLLLPSVDGPFQAVREAGASMLTLGFVTTPTLWATAVDFLAGATGLIIVALQIAYLPTLYAAYNRRETEVTLLSARAGQPPWGPELLARAHLNDLLSDLPIFYLSWERWAADVQESHASYPVLARFRSPHANASWVVALLAVCDSAALLHSVSPEATPFEARLALRMGFLCFRHLAQSFGEGTAHDPLPTDQITLTYNDFLYGYHRLEQVGFPLERTPQQAWRHFQGWRVNYEAAAYFLARADDAVPAEWAGPRRSGEQPLPFITLKNRTPDDPEGNTPTPYFPPPRDQPPLRPD